MLEVAELRRVLRQAGVNLFVPDELVIDLTLENIQPGILNIASLSIVNWDKSSGISSCIAVSSLASAAHVAKRGCSASAEAEVTSDMLGSLRGIGLIGGWSLTVNFSSAFCRDMSSAGSQERQGRMTRAHSVLMEAFAEP